MREKRRYLSREEIQRCELDILLSVQRFCDEQGLQFYLSGGTLLGAVRHKGFIPWDDDIDICMPRPDYDKFVRTYPSDSPYEIISNRLGTFKSPYTKVINITTHVESEISLGEAPGLWIDIFPVDGLPENMDKVVSLYKKCKLYRTLYSAGFAKLGTGRTIFTKCAKYIVKPLVRLWGTKWFSDQLEKIALAYPYETSTYVGAITWGLYGAGERMKKAEFEQKVMVNFEGHEFPAFSCWDSYLHGLYGDYMQLPPVEKRKTHDMKVYVKE